MTKDNNDRDRDISRIIALIPKRVTQKDNAMLNKPISMEEVEEAVNQMAQGKVLSLDGLTTNFFHLFWYMINEEVGAIVEESRRKRGVLKSFNATFLTLILKGEGAKFPGEFRHIALCNVIYKIISKVIANQLKPLLPSLIILEQYGFVKGR